MTSTIISFYIDVDPTERKNNPKWCLPLQTTATEPHSHQIHHMMILVPNEGRMNAFATMIAMTTTHILAKGGSTALLVVANKYVDVHRLRLRRLPALQASPHVLLQLPPGDPQCLHRDQPTNARYQ